MEIAIAVVTTVVVMAGIALAAWLLIRWHRQRPKREHLLSLTECVNRLTEQNATTEKLLTGLIDVSKAQVAQLLELTKAAGAIKAVLRGDPGGAYQEYDPAAAEREYEIQQIMENNGGDRQGAEDRVRERDMWSRVKKFG